MIETDRPYSVVDKLNLNIYVNKASVNTLCENYKLQSSWVRKAYFENN